MHGVKRVQYVIPLIHCMCSASGLQKVETDFALQLVPGEESEYATGFGPPEKKLPTCVGNPFAITFTSNAIVTSRFNASGLFESTTHATTSDYQSLYNKAVQEHNPQKYTFAGMSDTGYNTTMSIFHDSIVSINENLSIKLGYVPSYTVLMLPTVFEGNYKARDAAIEGIWPDPEPDYSCVRTGPPIVRPWPGHAVCAAYGFLEGRNLNRLLGECNNDGPESYVLSLHYVGDYLNAGLLQVDYELEVCPDVYSKMCKECGEKSREKMDSERYEELLESLLTKLISDGLHHIFEENRRYNYHADISTDNVRAIVISGEASPSAITGLGAIATKALGTDIAKLLTHIDPSEVIAYGAAAIARNGRVSSTCLKPPPKPPIMYRELRFLDYY